MSTTYYYEQHIKHDPSGFGRYESVPNSGDDRFLDVADLIGAGDLAEYVCTYYPDWAQDADTELVAAIREVQGNCIREPEYLLAYRDMDGRATVVGINTVGADLGWDGIDESAPIETQTAQAPVQAALVAWERTPEAAELNALDDAQRRSAHGFDAESWEPCAQEPIATTARQRELRELFRQFLAERGVAYDDAKGFSEI